MIDIDAIKSRNRKRRENYGESQQRADGDRWTVGADEDIDALIDEVDRLREALAEERALTSLQVQALVRTVDQYEVGEQVGSVLEDGIERAIYRINHINPEDQDRNE
jgi:hypothetical protein